MGGEGEGKGNDTEKRVYQRAHARTYHAMARSERVREGPERCPEGMKPRVTRTAATSSGAGGAWGTVASVGCRTVYAHDLAGRVCSMDAVAARRQIPACFGITVGPGKTVHTHQGGRGSTGNFS